MINEKPTVQICSDETVPIARVQDGSAHILHFTGGFRAARANDSLWRIEPIFDGGKPCRKGFVTTEHLQVFARQYGFLAIAFQRIHWTNGCYYAGWSPINPLKKNHTRGPADFWSSIASNLGRSRTERELENIGTPTHEKIAAILDARTETERLAQSISLSLRNADISVEQIADYYHERLVDLMASGKLDSELHAKIGDQQLFAHVHAFFIHLGAARDYLAAFIAHSIGKNSEKVDSLARLNKVLITPHFNMSPILQLMRSQGLLAPDPKKKHEWVPSGWLQDVCELRNRFVHKLPYGEKFLESLGQVKCVDKRQGLYRYVHPVVLNGSAEKDILNVVAHYYGLATAFFHTAAEVSGLSTEMPVFTDKDIISIEA